MSVATATVLSGGQPLEQPSAITSIAVWQELNRIPAAEIRLIDGSGPEQEFAVSDSSVFEPGAEIEIRLGYGSDTEHTVFVGIVFGHAVDADRSRSGLTVQLRDPTVRLTQIRRSAVYRDQTDTQAVESIASAAGLKVEVPTSSATHKELVQYRSTDWDFIISRADATGLVAAVHDGLIKLAAVQPSGAAKHAFDFGTGLISELEMAIDGAGQAESFHGVGWDAAANDLADPVEADLFDLEQGADGGEEAASAFGAGPVLLSHPVPVEPTELQAWADGRMRRSRLAQIRGRVRIPGQGDIALLDPMLVRGVGSRFNGATVVTGVAHRFSPDGWSTDVQFGLEPRPFAETRDVEELPAAGLLPPVNGLQIGLVTEFAEDPMGEERVRVNVAGIDGTDGGLWARIASPDAGEGRGLCWRPEIGDQVVLGFLNSDPRQPVVIGSLFGSVNTVPEAIGAATEDNYVKGLVTKGGLSLIFDDEKPAITIATEAGNSITIDDDEGALTIADQHGSSVAMSDAGITITSASDVTIEASGDMKLSAGGNVEIEGSQVDIK